MFTTIGELTNGLMEYANTMELSTVKNTPFIKALLGSGNGFTKAYIYIVQIVEHQYAVCDAHDDVCGNRYFPTGSYAKPFIQERDIIHMKYQTNSMISGDYSTVVSGLDKDGFFRHLLNILYKYDIIRIHPSMLSESMIHLFSNGRIKRNMESTFRDKKCSGTIEDFINIVIRDHESFNIGSLKQKEIKEVISKLKTIGIVPELSGHEIINATFERKR